MDEEKLKEGRNTMQEKIKIKKAFFLFSDRQIETDRWIDIDRQTYKWRDRYRGSRNEKNARENKKESGYIMG